MVVADESGYCHTTWTKIRRRAAATRPASLSLEMDRPWGAGQSLPRPRRRQVVATTSRAATPLPGGITTQGWRGHPQGVSQWLSHRPYHGASRLGGSADAPRCLSEVCLRRRDCDLSEAVPPGR